MLDYVREHDAWVAGLRERMRERRDELLPPLPFLVWGLSSPRLLPYTLTDIDSGSATLALPRVYRANAPTPNARVKK